MKRTMLFVQGPSDKRPKCADRFVPLVILLRGAEALRGWGGGRALSLGFRRWWMVECESADAGRTIIAGAPAHMHTGNTCNTCSAWMFNGRILAQSGAQ